MDNKKPHPLLVMKFGGTSVGSVDAMRRVVDITRSSREEYPNIVLVVSALSGVTNQLLEGARAALENDLVKVETVAEELRARHTDIAADLLTPAALKNLKTTAIDYWLDHFVNLCNAFSVLGEASPRGLDAVSSLGERINVRLLADIFSANGLPGRALDADQIILTDENHQSAHPLMAKTRDQAQARLLPIISAGKIPIITGFLSATETGITTTLGRGGSDYSAAIIGAALDAEEVWVWTDVDGVMTADPGVVRNAQSIPILTFREIGELAYFGAKVLHPRTIRPIIDAGIGLRIANTFQPTHPGTRIVSNGLPEEGDYPLKAVTSIENQRMITVEGRGMLGVPGVAARTFGAVAESDTSVTLITQASSEQSICFTIPSGSVQKTLKALEKNFARELQTKDIDRVWATEEVVIVTAVGGRMQYTPGVAGEIFTALAEARVNILAIAQGSSDSAISMVVRKEEGKPAVRAIHNLIVALPE